MTTRSRLAGAAGARMGLPPPRDCSDAYADAYADADADADSYADSVSYAYANIYADARTYGYASIYAEVGDEDDDDEQGFVSFSITEDKGDHMKSGLYIWAGPSGGVVVLRIGWIRRIAGDEYEALHMVTPLRGGDYKTMLADVAIDGPPAKWTFTRCLLRPSPLNRYHILCPVSLDPGQWAAVCPQPDGWSE